MLSDVVRCFPHVCEFLRKSQVTSAIESLQAQAVRFAEVLPGIPRHCEIEPRHRRRAAVRCSSEAKPGAGTAHLAEEKARALGLWRRVRV